MGYESNGYGALTVRDPTKVKEAEQALRDCYFYFTPTGEGHYSISFSGLRLYNCEGDDLVKLSEHFEGEINIQGEDAADFWMLVLQDGKAFYRQGNAFYDEPVPFNLRTMEVV